MFKTIVILGKLIPLALCITLMTACTPAAPALPDPLLDAGFAGFGTEGKTITTGPACCIGNMVLQPDGKIIVVGNGEGPDLLVMRYRSNGLLDPSFGSDGKVIFSYQGYILTETSVAVQADGKMIVVGTIDNDQSSPDFFLVRLTSTGAWDNTFGGDGIVTTNFEDDVVGSDDEAFFDFASSVLIQPDGKIVAAGTAWIDGDYDFAVARYNTNGSLDSSFGDSGKVTIGFGGDDAAIDIALQNDGKLVLVGQNSGWFDNDFAVARLNTDGSQDASFDGDGELTTGFGGIYESATAVALQPDGKIIVVGDNSGYTYSDDALLARYLPNGELDDSFDNDDGKRYIGSLSGKISDVGIQPDGKILLLGWHTSPDHDIKFAIYRLNPDTSLDTSFDDDGHAFINIAGEDFGRSIALQADGRIIGYGSSDDNHVLLRLWPDGTFDTGGQQALGFADSSVGNGADETAHAMVIQPDGRIILAGEVVNQNKTQGDMALARSLPDGQPDDSFGDHSRVTFDLLNNREIARALAIQPDGKIIAAGEIQQLTPELSNALIVRFNPNGTLDETFGPFHILDFLTGYDTATAVASTPDGKVVMAGTTFSAFGAREAFFVTRFNSDGTLDTTFDGDGRNLYEEVGRAHWASAMVVQPDLKIVLAGGIGGDFTLVRFNQDGSLDTTFGVGGKATTDMGGADRINALVLKSDGRFVAAGTRIIWPFGNDVVLAQYTMDGILESGGAGNPWGKAIVSWSEMDQAYAVDWRSDGQIVVVGCADSQINMALLATNDPPAPVKFTTDFVGNDACAFAVKFTGPNKLLIAGFQEFNGDRNMALARFDVTADLGLLNLQQQAIKLP